MQVKKSIFLYLPKPYIVAIDKYLRDSPPVFHFKKEYFYFIIDLVGNRQLIHKDKEFVSIDLQKLKCITCSNIDRYIKFLINGELLKRDTFSVGQKAYCYCLIDHLIQNTIPIEITPDTRLYKNIVKHQRDKRKHDNRLEPYLKQMKQLLLNIDMDYQSAKEWVNLQAEENKKHFYLKSIAMLEDKRFRFFKRNKTNYRLDTNFTNLKSDLRQFIRGDFVSIDLKNSQPFILSQLLKTANCFNNDDIPLCHYFNINNMVKWFGIQKIKTFSKVPQKSAFIDNGELLKFESVCASGLFYDDFLRQLHTPEHNRQSVKEMMFAILFSANIKSDYFGIR